MSRVLEPSITTQDAQAWPRRVRLFGIEIHAVNLAEATSELIRWTRQSDGVLRYVVTPNVDHIVMLQENEKLQAAYRDASLIVADGWPIVTASRWFGKPLPERVAGSDLIPAMFDAADSMNPLRVFLMGAGPGVAQRASREIHRRWPGVDIVGVDSPPIGFERCDEENQRILSLINAVEPDLLVIGLGAPKQELWIHAHRNSISAKVAVCAGATIDFLAGEKQRAPVWMRRCGLEWLHRVVTEPRRLARRYLRDALAFPRIAWRELRANRAPMA